MSVYINKPLPAYPWDEEDVPGQVRGALGLTSPPSNPYRQAVPVQALSSSLPASTPPDVSMPPSNPYRQAAQQTPNEDGALRAALTRASDNEIKTALINFGATLLGGQSNPQIVESARQRPLEAYKMRQAAMQALAQKAQMADKARLARAADLRADATQKREDTRLSLAQAQEKRAAGKFTSELEKEQQRGDPTSEMNKALRGKMSAAWPEFWKTLPEEMRNALTADDIESKWFQEGYLRKAKERNAALMGGMRLSPEEAEARGSFETKPEAIQEVLKLRFPDGYLEDNPRAAQAVKTIESGFKRGQDNRQLTEELGRLAKRAEDETEGAAARYVDQLKANGVTRAWVNIKNVEEAISKARTKHGQDIPGAGQTYFLTQLVGEGGRRLLSQEGRDVQRAVRELLDTKLRIATGATANQGEFRTFREILGAGIYDSDEDLLSGLRQAQRVLQEQDRIISAGLPASGIAWYEQRGGDRGWARPLSFGASSQDSGEPDPRVGRAPGATKSNLATLPGAKVIE